DELLAAHETYRRHRLERSEVGRYPREHDDAGVDRRDTLGHERRGGPGQSERAVFVETDELQERGQTDDRRGRIARAQGVGEAVVALARADSLERLEPFSQRGQ